MRRRAALLLCGVVLASGPVRAEDANASKDEKEILTTLQSLYDSYAKKDSATAARIYHEKLSYGHQSGTLQTKTAAVKDVQDGRWVDARLLKDPAPTVTLTGNTALVRTVANMTADCDVPKSACAVRVLWVLVKDPQGWQVIARQSSHSFKYMSVQTQGTKPLMK